MTEKGVNYLGALVVLGFVSSSCTALVDAGRQQCATDKDCKSRGSAFSDSQCVEGLCQEKSEQGCASDDDCGSGDECVNAHCQEKKIDPLWGCLEEDPPAVSTAPREVEIPISALGAPPDKDLATVLTGIHAKVCGKSDPTCLTPQQEVYSEVVLNEAGVPTGVFHLTVAGNFTGYLDIVDEEFYPTLYAFPPVIPASGQFAAATLISPSLVGALVTQLKNTEQREDRGIALLAAEDCQGNTAEGLVLEWPKLTQDPDLYPDVVGFYINGQLPSDDLEATTVSGMGGFVNFPAGTQTVLIKPQPEQGQDLESVEPVGNFQLIVRAGYLSVDRFKPPNQMVPVKPAADGGTAE